MYVHLKVVSQKSKFFFRDKFWGTAITLVATNLYTTITINSYFSTVAQTTLRTKGLFCKQLVVAIVPMYHSCSLLNSESWKMSNISILTDWADHKRLVPHRICEYGNAFPKWLNGKIEYLNPGRVVDVKTSS